MPTAVVAETNTKDDAIETTSAMIAITGNGGKSFCVSTPVSNNTWIIDSGASNHMIVNSRQITKVKPSLQKFVSIANGDEALIIGEGSLTLSDTLNLDDVLVVPSLGYNLLSISQIATTLSCIVIFWPNFCLFKDIQTKQMIGCGIKQGNLYYLDLKSETSNKLNQVLAMDDSNVQKNKAKISLQHRRLGHASFGYLKGYSLACLRKLMSLSFNVTYVSLQKVIELHFHLVGIKVLYLLWLFTLMYGGHLKFQLWVDLASLLHSFTIVPK